MTPVAAGGRKGEAGMPDGRRDQDMVHVTADRMVPGPDTPGQPRKTAFEAGGLWAGTTTVIAGGAPSQWHHHADHDTVMYMLTGRIRVDWGERGDRSFVIGPGEFAFIGRGVIHRAEVVDGDGDSTFVAVRVGSGETVVNVDGPGPNAPLAGPGLPAGLERAFPRPVSAEPLVRLPSSLVPARAPLAGRDVTLEPLDAGRHAEELYEASHADDRALRIWDHLTYGPYPDVDAYRDALRAQSASFDPVYFAIRANGTGRACGQATFMDIDPPNGAIEIGHIWFGPELQRSRGATEALFMMLRHAMDDLAYRRMQWRCNAMNAKSRAAARRLGFRFEGIHYNDRLSKGRNRDTACYSILDDEWPEVRSRIAAWLDPDNFDGDGTARMSLSGAMGDRAPSRRGAGEGA